MKSRIFVKLLVAALVVIAACTISLDLLIGRAWENMLRREIQTSLRQKTEMFAARVSGVPSASAWIRSLRQAASAAGARITVIDSSGKVLADSEADPAKMENHAPGPNSSPRCMGRLGTPPESARPWASNCCTSPCRFPAERYAWPIR